MASNDHLPLGSEFVAPTKEEWRALAEKALKGGTIEGDLQSQTYDGINVRPLYTREDWAPDSASPLELATFIRRGTYPDQGNTPWSVGQVYVHPDPDEANAQILQDLQGGVNSIELKFDRAVRLGHSESEAQLREAIGDQGVALHDIGDLGRALNSVQLDLVDVSIDAGSQFLPASLALVELFAKQGVSGNNANVAFNADPIGCAAEGGRLSSFDESLKEVTDLALLVGSKFSNATCVMASSSVYHNAGATNVFELSVLLATGVRYLKSLIEAGLPIEQAFAQIRFTTAVDADLFSSAAKIRALRLLWSRVADASGFSNPNSRIEAVTSERMLTKYDPWVNILRGATAGFSGVLGGADRVTIYPFDKVIGLPTTLSRRVARNTHAILAEESMLTRVADPAGGSWYLETLTQNIAKLAWEGFQQIERNGGVIALLQDGSIANAIGEMRRQRIENVSRRIESCVGVNEFPNLEEESLEVVRPDLDVIREQSLSILEAAPKQNYRSLDLAEHAGQISRGAPFLPRTGNELVEPLPSFRDSAFFEALREKSDAALAEMGSRPKVFLANWGTPAEFTARMTFAKNLFESGGIEAQVNGGYTTEDGLVEAYRSSGAKLIVLCSTDRQYEECGEALVRVLKGCNPLITYVAGRPSNKDQLHELGVDQFLFAGMNVLELLEQAHEQLKENR